MRRQFRKALVIVLSTIMMLGTIAPAFATEDQAEKAAETAAKTETAVETATETASEYKMDIKADTEHPYKVLRFLSLNENAYLWGENIKKSDRDTKEFLDDAESVLKEKLSIDEFLEKYEKIIDPEKGIEESSVTPGVYLIMDEDGYYVPQLIKVEDKDIKTELKAAPEKNEEPASEEKEEAKEGEEQKREDVSADAAEKDEEAASEEKESEDKALMKDALDNAEDETTTVTIRKHWSDNSDATGVRPDPEDVSFIFEEAGVAPEITVTMTREDDPEEGDTYAFGEMAECRVTVTNTGGVAATDLLIEIDESGDGWSVDYLEVGASWSGTFTYNIEEADIIAGSVTLHGHVTGSADNNGSPYELTASPELSLPVDAPRIHPDVLFEVVEGHLRMTTVNNGNITISNGNISHDVDVWTIPGTIYPGDALPYTITSEKPVSGDVVLTVDTVFGQATVTYDVNYDMSAGTVSYSETDRTVPTIQRSAAAQTQASTRAVSKKPLLSGLANTLKGLFRSGHSAATLSTYTVVDANTVEYVFEVPEGIYSVYEEPLDDYASDHGEDDPITLNTATYGAPLEITNTLNTPEPLELSPVKIIKHWTGNEWQNFFMQYSGTLRIEFVIEFELENPSAAERAYLLGLSENDVSVPYSSGVSDFSCSVSGNSIKGSFVANISIDDTAYPDDLIVIDLPVGTTVYTTEMSPELSAWNVSVIYGTQTVERYSSYLGYVTDFGVTSVVDTQETLINILNNPQPSGGESVLSVTKVWDDDSDSRGLRPDEIEVHVYHQDYAFDYVVNDYEWTKSGNIWYCEPDLPVALNSDAVVYEVLPANSPYESSAPSLNDATSLDYSDNATITNTLNVPPTKTITVTKHWENDVYTGSNEFPPENPTYALPMRPSNVTITLTGYDGPNEGAEYTTTASGWVKDQANGVWTYEFEVPDDGTLYEAREEPVPDQYFCPESVIVEVTDSVSFTNTGIETYYSPASISPPLKVWEDEEEAWGFDYRPHATSATFCITMDDSDEVLARWTETFSATERSSFLANIPDDIIFDNGHSYFIYEEPIQGYHGSNMGWDSRALLYDSSASVYVAFTNTLEATAAPPSTGGAPFQFLKQWVGEDVAGSGPAKIATFDVTVSSDGDHSIALALSQMSASDFESAEADVSDYSFSHDTGEISFTLRMTYNPEICCVSWGLPEGAVVSASERNEWVTESGTSWTNGNEYCVKAYGVSVDGEEIAFGTPLTAEVADSGDPYIPSGGIVFTNKVYYAENAPVPTGIRKSTRTLLYLTAFLSAALAAILISEKKRREAHNNKTN